MTQNTIDNMQASLALTEYVPLNGYYPSRDDAGGESDFTLGQIGIFAGIFAPAGDTANGQLLQISSNSTLYSLLGTYYGGDGRSNFALPNLAGTTMVGNSYSVGQTSGTSTVSEPSSSTATYNNAQPSLAVTYEIAVSGVYPSSGISSLATLGTVAAFAGSFATPGFLPADGRLLQISQYSALYELIGATYGGDGQTTFALPNLTGRDIIGAGPNDPVGAVLGQPSVTLTNAPGTINNQQPSLALNYLIAVQGIYPSRGGDQNPTTPTLGQIIAYAGYTRYFSGGDFVPADGRLLQINQYQALYSVLGTTYGGDGVTTFALPDLRDKTIIGTGQGNGTYYVSGEQVGENTLAQPVVYPVLGAESFASPSGSQINAQSKVTFTLSVNEPVTVTQGQNGLPTLALNDGGVATYSGAVGTAVGALTFTYTVGSSDNVADLKATAFNQLPAGTTILDSGNKPLDEANFQPIDTGVRVVTTPPVLSVQGTTQHAVQDGSAVAVLAVAPTIDDPNGPGTLSGASVVITDLQAGDLLGVAGAQSGTLDGGKIAYSFASGALNFTGTDTIAQYEAALADLTYQDTGTQTGADFDPQRTLSFVVADGSLNSTPQSSTLATDPVCFAAGTRIRTVRGDIAVEELAAGDLVVTASGASRPIRWLGHRKLDLRAHPEPTSTWPVRIEASAFGNALPVRDLWVSPGHCLFVDGFFIPARALLNGSTIVQVPVETVTYWHVELDSHDVLFAEGLSAESYLDSGNRAFFAGRGDVVLLQADLDPDGAAVGKAAPVRTSGPEVATFRSRLVARAFDLGHATTTDPGLHIVADGHRVEPIKLGTRCLAFALPAGSKRAELVSKTFRPCDIDPGRSDSRVLGVCIKRLEIDGTGLELSGDLPAGTWHKVEERAGYAQRWTRCAVLLPAGARIVIVDLAAEGRYWVKSSEQRTTRAA